MMKDGYLQVHDIKIHYLINEYYDPEMLTLLFIPGIMMPAWIWKEQLDYFSLNYNVVAIDPRSHGDSQQASEGHYAFSMAKDIQEVVHKLDLKKFILIGWSLGVPQVINYAAHFQTKELVGLVLVDGAAGIDSSLPFYHSMVDYWTQFQMDRLSNTSKFIESIFKQPQTEDYVEKLFDVAMRMPTNTVMTLIENYILQDFRTLLPRISTPTYIATIEGPRLEYMRSLQALIPNSHFEVFQAAGHALFVDQPEKFNQSLDDFVKTL